MEKRELSKKQQNFLLKTIIYALFGVVFILPTQLIVTYVKLPFAMDKLIFVGIATILLVFEKIITRKISKAQIVYLILTVIFTILCRNVAIMMMVPLVLLEDLVEYREEIWRIIKKSKILYVCLGFTIFYTILYKYLGIVRVDRWAFSAIGEINQSGLAIFCLAILLMQKNKIVGYITMGLGLLTVSRSYILAVVIFAISHLKFSKKLISKSLKHKSWFAYPSLVIYSSVILIGIGAFYIYQNSIGNVYWGDDVGNRVVNLMDYSNLFRFATNVLLIMIFIGEPLKLFTGLTDIEYIKELKYNYELIQSEYKYLEPHNLFFSHLRLYGLFSVVETWYIGRVLSKLMTKRNFAFFLTIFLYSILLGAGLYSYWIFLTAFTMMGLEEEYGKE